MSRVRKSAARNIRYKLNVYSFPSLTGRGRVNRRIIKMRLYTCCL